MFSRLKRSLVESYVGALALGWIFAYAILDFVAIFTTPLSYWVTQSQVRALRMPDLAGVVLRAAMPDLLASPALFLLGYVLLRWLYFPPQVESSEPVAKS